MKTIKLVVAVFILTSVISCGIFSTDVEVPKCDSLAKDSIKPTDSIKVVSVGIAVPAPTDTTKK